MDNKLEENVVLEYKSATLLEKNDTKAVSKAVSALANSAGGHFIIGISAKSGKPVAREGFASPVSKTDWLHQVINNQISPPVESVEITELTDANRRFYVLAVPSSPRAPHQCSDQRYYKRRGSLSEPMEHYEIEDVRNRPKDFASPLSVTFVPKDGVGFLRHKNRHHSSSVADIHCRVRSNADFDRSAIHHLEARGLRQLDPQSEKYFVFDGIGLMLEQNDNAEIEVAADYQFHGRLLKETIIFHLADYRESVIFQSPVADGLRIVSDRIEQLNCRVSELTRTAEALKRMADGTGLRLSHRTLTALKDLPQLLDAREFDWEGYRILLDISTDEAFLLYHVFATASLPAEQKRSYEELPAELREKFERRFKPPM